MKNILNKFVCTALIAGSVAVSSCTTDDLNPTLAQQKEDQNAFSNVDDMEGVLKGMYNRLTPAAYYGRDYLVTNEARTPNIWANGSSGRFVTQASFSQGATGLYFWDNAYAAIATANILIGLDVETLEGDLDYARHMQGQAYAVRALAHFDLLKTFGQQHTGGNLGVPYITEFKGEDLLPARGTVEDNKNAIYADLEQAYQIMDESFFDSSKEFVSKYVAPALESRVAVYFGDWERARDAADLVIESGKYSVVAADQFIESFATDGGVNSIFELAYRDTDNPGSDSMEYIYRGCSYGDISVTQNTFDNLYESDSDVRTNVFGTETCGDDEFLRNIGKFPSRSSNINVIRYEEVVLNYAEALYELGEGDPLQWLNMIPEHRNADTYSTVTKENILEERREEFIFEGLYYWDLLRTEQDIVRSEGQVINIPYGDPRTAWPIPLSELDANSNIVQNPGYQG
jgi:hypothetical protein